MKELLVSPTANLTRSKRALLTTLSKVPYFDELQETELLYLVRQGYPQTVPPLQFVCREGDVANSFYIILSGKVEVLSLAQKKHISVLYEGDFFGEIALFIGTPRVATCRTLTESRFFVIHRDHLKHILMNHREIADKIALKLLDRQNTLIELGIIENRDQTTEGILQQIRKRLQSLNP
jgi:CRP-like cAMP-binding protein